MKLLFNISEDAPQEMLEIFAKDNGYQDQIREGEGMIPNPMDPKTHIETMFTSALVSLYLAKKTEERSKAIWEEEIGKLNDILGVGEIK